MRTSLVEEADCFIDKNDINRAMYYLVEVYQYLEENKKDLLIEKLKQYREETEKILDRWFIKYMHGLRK